LVFAQAQDIPAIYMEDEAGKEALVNVNFEDRSTIVVHRVVPKLILRDGDQVARLENRSFTTEQSWRETGTSSPTIKRIDQTGTPHE
jgi:type IV secretory pathway VirB9-like protein